MNNPKIRKVIVYSMVALMLLSSLLMGVGMIF